jgi:hypothetical protein
MPVGRMNRMLKWSWDNYPRLVGAVRSVFRVDALYAWMRTGVPIGTSRR